jgi:hypothetical protein
MVAPVATIHVFLYFLCLTTVKNKKHVDTPHARGMTERRKVRVPTGTNRREARCIKTLPDVHENKPDTSVLGTTIHVSLSLLFAKCLKTEKRGSRNKSGMTK